MKNNDKLITVLNKILVDELQANNHNIFNPKECDKLDWEKLQEAIEKETIEEVKQAEWLIKRIIFLEIWRTRQHSISAHQDNSDNNYEMRSNVG